MSLLVLVAGLLGGAPAGTSPLPEARKAASAAQSPARARANLVALISNDDYPAQAIRDQEQGTVAFRLEVSSHGRVTSCHVTASSGSEALDTTTCRLMSERPRFTPARDQSGRAIADTVHSRVRWVLPEETEEPLVSMALRGAHNIWEVTSAGKQRSCRRELQFESGERVHLAECLPLDREFVHDAAAYLQAKPSEVLTVRLENMWIIEPTVTFPIYEADRGELLVRGEGDYRLNEDLSVRDCVVERISARFDWRPAPCFRSSFAGDLPLGTRAVRLAVQWVVSRGPDTQRPTVLPSFVPASGGPPSPITVVEKP